MMSDKIIYDCPNATCTEPLYTGRCKQACWDRYNGKTTKAKWKHRAEYNDFICVECSNCGFRVENYKAVVFDCSDTKFKDVKYKFCPMCGKPMGV
jgi:membrane protease subunit (stomatin/prohibitin family)